MKIPVSLMVTILVTSPDSIAEKVCELINDPVTMKRMSKNAIRHCCKLYHPDVIAKESVLFYKSIISKYN